MTPPFHRTRAQALRRNTTEEENKLWFQFLRHYLFSFGDKSLLDLISLTFIAPKLSWSLNWTARSIIPKRDFNTISNVQL